MNINIIISLVLGAISLIGFIYTVGFAWGSTKRDISALKKIVDGVCKEVNDLSDRVTKLDIQMSPFWKIVETRLTELLHSSHTPRYDDLLSRFRDNLSFEELFELRKLLDDDLDNTKKSNDTGRSLAIILISSRVDSKIEINNSIKKTTGTN